MTAPTHLDDDAARSRPGRRRDPLCDEAIFAATLALFAEEGYAGIQQLAHDTNLLFYASEEAREGRDAYKEKRTPDFAKFPRRP